MAVEDSDLERLLHPLSTERFFSDYWEKKQLFLQRRDPEYFHQLMTRIDLATLISESDMRYPAIQLAKGGALQSRLRKPSWRLSCLPTLDEHGLMRS